MRIRVVKMNKIKLMYLRWKNTSKWYNKKEINKMTLLDVFYGIKPTNTYIGWLHNNLKLYRAIQYNPENKILKRMFMDGHLSLFAMKRTWKFARRIYKQERERWNVWINSFLSYGNCYYNSYLKRFEGWNITKMNFLVV